MDAGDVSAAMGGFFLGQMFAGQAKPGQPRFISVRVDKEVDVGGILIEIVRDVFLGAPIEAKLNLEFTDKGEMKFWKNKAGSRAIGEKPLFVFGLCGMAWTKKDYFFTLGLRSENGAPIELNIALFRHLLTKLKSNKTEYEIW